MNGKRAGNNNWSELHTKQVLNNKTFDGFTHLTKILLQ